MSQYPCQMRFHWCAERPHAYGSQVSDGYVTITGDPFDPNLGDVLANSIEKLKGWQDCAFVVKSLTLIGTKPVESAAQSRADTLAGLLADAGRLLTAAQCADASIEAAWDAELDEWCKRRDAALSDGDGERGGIG